MAPAVVVDSGGGTAVRGRRRGGVAVVVPLGHWSELASRLMEKLLPLCHHPDDQIVLVDWGELELPPAIAADQRIRHLTAEQPGIALQRNHALARLPESIEWVAMIDSDAEPEEGWLEAGIDCLASDPGCAAVGGAERMPAWIDHRRRLVGLAQQSILLSGGKRHQRSGRQRSGLVDELATVNLIARRSAIDQVGRFDQRLLVGEDSALSLDLRAAGWRLCYRADQIVRHAPRRPWGPFIRQRITLGYGIPPLLSRYLRVTGPHRLVPELLPFAALIWFVAGWLAPLPLLWSCSLLVWGGWVVAEAIRLAPGRRDLPMLMALIASGNLLPGAGTVLALIRWPVQIERFYRNEG